MSETTTAELRPGDAVRVDGWAGVAFTFRRHPAQDPAPVWVLVCDDEDHGDDEDHDGGCWVLEDDEDPGEDRDTAVVVMVGDDREHVVSVSDVHPIDRDDYCGGCGQIGCGHDGYDR